MRQRTKYGVAGGTLLAIGAWIWNVVEKASTVDDLFEKRGRVLGGILFLLETPWTGALVALTSLIAFAWLLQSENDRSISTNKIGELDYDPAAEKRFCPKTIDALFDGVYAANTTRETKAATEPYVGLWLAVEKPITDIDDDIGPDGRGGAWTRVTVNYASLSIGGKIEPPRPVELYFFGEDARLIRALREGDNIRAIGRIRSITGFLGGISLVPALLQDAT